VPIDLGGGESFLLRGSIDRVDEAADGSFHVWDYKSGGTWGHGEERGLDGGRQIQHALYAMALETLLVRAGRPARVSQSGYFFPGRRGEGQRMRPSHDATEARAVLRRLFGLLRAGAFVHATDEEDCRFCDFQEVCGGARRAGERAAVKIEKATLPALVELRRSVDAD
jgi:ATP-dependent helicase/nuclease subunit B